MFVRALIIVVLIAVIAGGSWFAYQKLFEPPAKVRKTDRDKGAPEAAQRRVDPLEAPLNEALGLVRGGQIEEALAVLQPLVSKAHTSQRFAELKTVLGELNIATYLSSKPGPGKTAYSVVRGDSIAKISAKFKVPPELILRVNNLTSIDLQIGQELLIPQSEFSAVVSPSRKTLTLFRGLDFFKEYELPSVQAPRKGMAPGVSLKVSDKISWSGGVRVAFGNPEYHGAVRWINLNVPGATLYTHALPTGAAAGDATLPATGFALEAADMNELFLLLSRDSIVQVTE